MLDRPHLNQCCGKCFKQPVFTFKSHSCCQTYLCATIDTVGIERQLLFVFGGEMVASFGLEESFISSEVDVLMPVSLSLAFNHHLLPDRTMLIHSFFSLSKAGFSRDGNLQLRPFTSLSCPSLRYLPFEFGNFNQSKFCLSFGQKNVAFLSWIINSLLIFRLKARAHAGYTSNCPICLVLLSVIISWGHGHVTCASGFRCRSFEMIQNVEV